MSVKNAETVKGLKKQKSCLEADYEVAKEIAKTSNQNMQRIKSQIDSIQKQIDAIEIAEITVSDHALLRFLERSEGFDIEGLKNQIEGFFKNCEFKNGTFPIQNGVKAVVKNGVIVTVI